MSEESPWSEPPEDFVINPLVSVLKRTRRWRRDGRSLRALNRHWCAALSRHVVEIRPHWSRSLALEDIDSLRKFPNLTSLDTTEFEHEDGNDAAAMCQKLSMALSKLPHLSRLEVNCFFDFLEDEHVRSLTGITSLDLSDYDFHLPKISCLPLEELSGWLAPSDVVEWISKISTLKTLHLDMFRLPDDSTFVSLIEHTKGLHSVSIRSFWNDLWDHLPQMTNLVSADVSEARVELFSDLPRITCLKWNYTDVVDLYTIAFRCLMKRLKTLCLRCHNDDYNHDQIPDDLFVGSTALESLELWNCRLTEGLIEDLSTHHLTHLYIRRCKTPGPLSFIGKLTSLERLEIEFVYDPCPTLEMNLTLLAELRHLFIEVTGCWRNSELMKEICQLSQLESLSLYDRSHRHTQSIPHDTFDALENLHNLSSLNINVLMSRLSTELFFDMNILTGLETLEVKNKYLKGGEDEAFKQRLVSILKEKAPYLKLTVYIS